MMPNKFACDQMTAITNAWYNQLCESLQLSYNHFQLFQPVLVAQNNDDLWARIHSVPPKTLKYNSWYYDQPRFFSEYAAIVNQLRFQESSFEESIGEAVYTKWKTYLQGLAQSPPDHTLPTVWFQWALLHAPELANTGRSALASELLIKSGLAALRAYQGPNARSPELLPAYADLISTLQASPSVAFEWNSINGKPDVSNTWVPANDPNLFGLWTGSWCGFLLNQKFAQHPISIAACFEHVSVVAVTPGPWYHAGLLHLALASRSVPPWNSAAGWDKYFGQDGSLNYAIGAVVAVDGISLTIYSDAAFAPEEQALIGSQVHMGYWPMYCPQTSAVVRNELTFDGGKMTIRCQSAPGKPVIIGGNVFRIGQYLGGN
ncbi:hypothetical protein [Longitalea arenae]|uniref:hypothetical protein n=1 Tax=Longitalea arenae TaxID=2812558 RepID=UPI0019676364|nr:hypothetical protein [Longitalea arenae]